MQERPGKVRSKSEPPASKSLEYVEWKALLEPTRKSEVDKDNKEEDEVDP